MFWIAGSQLGYDRLGVKRAVACGPPWMGYPTRRAVKFSLVDEKGKAVLEKYLQPVEKSFDSNPYWIADFSEIHENGKYMLQVGGISSYPFSIEDDVYSRVVRKGYRYFSYQRCGTKVEGVHEPCHLDDGWRTDTKQHWDAVGGWHDAGDVRKGMSLHTLAAYALLHLHESLMDIGDSEKASEVLNEALWGNNYFLKMQDPETGNVFICVYRKTLDHRPGSEGNVLTDNVVGTADDRPILVLEASAYKDRRGIPLAVRNALGFVALEAAMARTMAEKDPEYSKRCLEAACKAWRWAHKPENYEEHVNVYASAWNVLAGLEMFKATGGRDYLQEAVEKANHMVGLQEKTDYGDYNGFFWADPSKEKVYWHITGAADPLIALVKLCLELPDDPSRCALLEAVKLHVSFLKKVSELSPFFIIPCVFSDKPLTEDKYRKAGKLYYRFFYPRRLDWWWVGTNSVVLSNAVGLLYAYQVTGDEGLKALAEAQLEWVFGNNPFRVCMMVGEGTNTTTVYSAKYLFKDWDGIIPGGIVNGIGGTENDEPCYYPTYFYPAQGGPDWETKEYWTPHNAYFAWAISQLRKLSK